MKLGGLLFLGVVAVTAPLCAQSLELDITEDGINRLVAQLGDPSSGGVFEINALSELGYKNCHSAGALECGGSSGQSVPMMLCEGPDGRTVMVPGEAPVSWQWWITKAHFTIQAQELRFSAVVRYRIGSGWFEEERSVPATVGFDVASQRLRMEIEKFKVPMTYGSRGVAQPITDVDVGRHMSFAIPVQAQTFRIRDLEGRVKAITSRAQTASVEYLPGKIHVSFYASFN